MTRENLKKAETIKRRMNNLKSFKKMLHSKDSIYLVKGSGLLNDCLEVSDEQRLVIYGLIVAEESRLEREFEEL